MFTLRRVTQSNVEINQVIGDSYTLVDRESSPNNFRVDFEKFFEKPHVADLDPKSDKDTRECYALLHFKGDTQPLYKNDQNYIMTENGKTFKNLTYK